MCLPCQDSIHLYLALFFINFNKCYDVIVIAISFPSLKTKSTRPDRCFSITQTVGERDMDINSSKQRINYESTSEVMPSAKQ